MNGNKNSFYKIKKRFRAEWASEQACAGDEPGTRRIMSVYFFAYLSGLVFAAFIIDENEAIPAVAVIAASVICISAALIKKHRFAILFIAGMMMFVAAYFQHDGLEKDEGGFVKIRGTVSEIANTNKTFLMELNNGYRVQVYLKGKVSEEEAGDFAGREVIVAGVVEKPQPARNPNGFSYRQYLKQKRCNHVIYPEIVEKGRIKKHLLHRVQHIKQRFYDELKTVTGEKSASLIVAILYGDKGKLEEDSYEAFQKNGLAHILAASGLHVGIIYFFLSLIIGQRRSFARYGTIGGILFLYALIAGFSPSITRAVLMIYIHMAARMTHRQYDLEGACVSAAFIVLIKNPLLIGNAGFQFSFLAVIVISRVNQKLELHAVEKSFHKRVWPILAVQISMMPFIAYNFNVISVVSIPMNLLIMLFIGILLQLSFVSLIMFALFGRGIEIIFWYAGQIAQAVNAVNEIVDNNSRFNMYVSSPPLWSIVMIYSMGLLISSEFFYIRKLRKSYEKPIAAIAILLLLTAVSTAMTDTDFKDKPLWFIDVGQGNAMLLRDGGRAILIDGGGRPNFDVGKKILMPALLKNGVSKVDAAIVTHLDGDHFDGIASIASRGLVDKLITYRGNRHQEDFIIKRTGLKRRDILYVASGDEIRLTSEIHAKFLWPEKKNLQEEITELSEKEENSRSLIVRIDMGGAMADKKLLITGDVSADDERAVLDSKQVSQRDLDADILQIPHHGSKHSSTEEFLKAVSPEIAVFEVGRNNYGHPSEEVVERLKKLKIIFFRNDMEGCIGVGAKHGGLRAVKKIR